MNMQFTIRSEAARDIDQARAIVCAAFPSDAESKLVDALRKHDQAVISLVAVHGNDVLGHILFSPVSLTPPGGATPPHEAKGLGLAPIAVRPDVQLQGIGTQLIWEGLRLCKEKGYDFCVVLGDPKYYGRFGFEQASSFGIGNEYGVDEAFGLVRFTGHEVAGLVQYAPEFAMFSL